MDTTADDIHLAELITLKFKIDKQCPFILSFEDRDENYQYCPQGYSCYSAIAGKCYYLHPEAFTKTSFYEFNKRDEVGEVI